MNPSQAQDTPGPPASNASPTQTAPKAQELSLPAAAASAPEVVRPRFHPRIEKAEVWLRGPGHSIIHYLQQEIGNARSFILLALEEGLSLPPAFSAQIQDPREPRPGMPAWGTLNVAEKVRAFSDELTGISYCEKLKDQIKKLDNKDEFDEGIVTRFYQRFLMIAAGLERALEDFPPEWKHSDYGVPAMTALNLSKRILQAQLDLANPPSRFPLVDLRDLAGEASQIVTQGSGAYLPGCIIVGGFPDKFQVPAQRDLLLRAIAECAKNSNQAGLSKGFRKEDNHMWLLGGTSSDGRRQLILQDNCGGIEDSWLVPDIHGIPDRPWICNLKASSKDSGVGCCELYYIAQAMRCELKIENHYGQTGQRLGARIVLTFPPVRP